MDNEFLSDDEEMQQENGRSDDHDDDDDDSSDDDDDDDNDNDHDDYDDHDDDDMNYIQESLAREAAVARLTDQRIAEIMSNKWERNVRTLAVNYVLTTGEGFQFSEQTMYRSVIYRERYLAEQTIPSGDRCTVRLLAIACLSLSAKLSSDHVPSLSRYPLGNHFIHVQEIRRTEILVLNELNWDMNVVTPFSFMPFFVSRFCRHVEARYLTRINTSDIIMSVLSELRLMNHRPSVIAAAATLLAVNTNLTGDAMELLINDLPINGFLQIDDVSHCYYRLRELMNN